MRPYKLNYILISGLMKFDFPADFFYPKLKLVCNATRHKALEVGFIMSRKILIVINGDNKKKAKHESVRIKRTVLHFHGLIVDSKRVCRG